VFPDSVPSLPIVDHRHGLSWPCRLPARLGTASLWMGVGLLLGPVKLAALTLLGGVVAPVVLLLDRPRHREQARGRRPIASSCAVKPPSPGLPRAALAARLGVSELQLFRARHATVCTVHHDAKGNIVELCVASPPAVTRPSPDAHPVG
jgi:hypothetical protein